MKKKNLLKVISLLVALLYIMSFTACNPTKATVKNVILLIGDGMGDNQINMARLSKGSDLHMDQIETKIKVGTNNLFGQTTDSAAAATAIACGVKTFNGWLGFDGDLNEMDSLIDVSKGLNKKTGLVTTVTITHATPAAFAAHSADRGRESDIAIQMMKQDIDVLMGGGRNNFEQETDNGLTLIEDAKNEKGYTYVSNLQDMNKADGDKLLGLFTETGPLPYDRDRDKDTIPSLSQMTQKAIDTLSKDEDGFFLMVEGGKIDTAGHANDKENNIGETLAFDEAVKVALDFAKKDKNTLVIVTADHETGDLKADDLEDITTYKFNSGNHTSARVSLFAYGPASDRFNRDIENNEIFTIIKNAMENADEPSSTLSTAA